MSDNTYEIAMTYTDTVYVSAKTDDEAKEIAIKKFIDMHGRELVKNCDIDIIGKIYNWTEE